MKFISLLIMIIFSYNFSIAQQQQFIFHNKIEERAFKAIEEEELTLPQKIDFLLGVSPDSEEETVLYVEKQIKLLLEGLSEVSTKKGYGKLAKKLFQDVHEKLFKKYILNPSFNQIFEEGIYNCATASALYAVLLEELKIPYTIQATTNHVFIIIDPNQNPIMLEATDPVNGLAQINKTAYIKMLANMKIISQDEFQTYSTEELYQKYVNQEKQDINFKELVGVLYMNSSIKHIQEQDFQNGGILIKKAIALRPTEMNKRLRLMSLLGMLVDVNFDSLYTLDPVIDLLEYDLFKADLVNSVTSNFVQKCDKYSRLEEDSITYYNLYNYLITNVNQKKHFDFYKTIKYFHFFTLGMREVKLNDPPSEIILVYFDSAYYYKKEEKMIELMSQSIINFTQNLRKKPDDLESKLNFYKLKYPYLKNTPNLYKYLLDSKANFVASYFWDDKKEEGLEAFQNLMSSLEGKTLDEECEEIVGVVYGAISSYFVRKKDEKEGKKWLIEGLKLVPNSKTLARKMETFEEYELMYGK